LKTMLYSLVACAAPLCSAVILLVSVMYIFALLFMQGVVGHLNENPDSSMSLQMDKYYGSLYKSLWTLLCAVTGGYDWATTAEPITHIGYSYIFAFLFYISFVLLGLLNILNGIFVNAALQSSAMNRELVIDSVMAQRESMIADMVSLFLEVDPNRSVKVTWDEFLYYVRDEKIKAYFMFLELDTSSAVKIFDLLDVEQTGEVELGVFIEGCIKLRGNAKVVDFSIMHNDIKHMEFTMRTNQETMIQRLENILGLEILGLENANANAHDLKDATI